MKACQYLHNRMRHKCARPGNLVFPGREILFFSFHSGRINHKKQRHSPHSPIFPPRTNLVRNSPNLQIRALFHYGNLFQTFFLLMHLSSQFAPKIPRLFRVFSIAVSWSRYINGKESFPPLTF